MKISLSKFFHRDPDFVIGGNEAYMRRWWIIPRNRVLNIYLHQVLRDDDDRALHDHPWWNVSIILRGGYWEVMPRYPSMWPHNRDLETKWRGAGSIVLRRPSAPHRLLLASTGPVSYCIPPRRPCWTLFITGPRVRTWGFWCSFGWRDWRTFTDPTDKGRIGRGCE